MGAVTATGRSAAMAGPVSLNDDSAAEMPASVPWAAASESQGGGGPEEAASESERQSAHGAVDVYSRRAP